MPKKSIENKARHFNATRKHHAVELAEDYTELIADLIEEEGEARTCEIAKRLGVSHVTAVRALQRLDRAGYVETKPYKPVMLTAKGRQVASFSRYRHDLLIRFLIKLGVPRKVAELDAEGMEHHISETTLNIIKKHVEDAA